LLHTHVCSKRCHVSLYRPLCRYFRTLQMFSVNSYMHQASATNVLDEKLYSLAIGLMQSNQLSRKLHHTIAFPSIAGLFSITRDVASQTASTIYLRVYMPSTTSYMEGVHT